MKESKNNEKTKNVKKKFANLGGSAPNLEVNCKQFGPLILAFLDFLELHRAWLTNVHDGLLILAIRLEFLDTWQAHTYAHMVDHWARIVPDHVTTKL